VKLGDLVRYKRCSHESLQHLLGLMVATTPVDWSFHSGLYVIWNQDRNRGPANTIMLEYMDELEVVSESR
jgi:hypothetical protein